MYSYANKDLKIGFTTEFLSRARSAIAVCAKYFIFVAFRVCIAKLFNSENFKSIFEFYTVTFMSYNGFLAATPAATASVSSRQGRLTASRRVIQTGIQEVVHSSQLQPRDAGLGLFC